MDMEDLFLDYIAFEFVEESFWEETDHICPRCHCRLLKDVESNSIRCGECRETFVVEALEDE